MAKIPVNIQGTKFLLENYTIAENQKLRPYLGMSAIGEECSRKLFFSFRFASYKPTKELPIKLYRIFERGHWEEHRTIADLKAIGIEVFRRDEDGNKIEIFGSDGETQERVEGFAGHAAGHMDGRVDNVPEAPKTEHLLEIKSMNQKRFDTFKKSGVKESDPKYYAQVQRYMHGKGLKRTLFVARNKNTEELEVERIHYDKTFCEMLIAKEQDIIVSDSPHWPAFSRSYFGCKFCDHFEICHDDKAPAKTCRSCTHVDLATEGAWLCALNNDKPLNLDDQLRACSSYKRAF